MYSFENQACSLTQIGLIKAHLQNKYDVIHHCFVRLFTAEKKIKRFLDSDLSGCLCLTINLTTSNFHFLLYDLHTYETLFNALLYDDFLNGYTIIRNYFHCFEVLNGFVGFHFANSTDGEKLHDMMTENLKESFAKKRIKSYTYISEDEVREKASEKAKAIKAAMLSKYNIEESTELKKISEVMVLDEDKVTEAISHFYFKENNETIAFIGNKASGKKVIKENKLPKEVITLIQGEGIEVNDIDSFISIMARHLINEDNRIREHMSTTKSLIEDIRAMKSNNAGLRNPKDGLIGDSSIDSISSLSRRMRNTLLSIRNNRSTIVNDSSSYFPEALSHRPSIYTLYDPNRFRATLSSSSAKSTFNRHEGMKKSVTMTPKQSSSAFHKQLTTQPDERKEIKEFSIEEETINRPEKIKHSVIKPINSIITEEAEKEEAKPEVSTSNTNTNNQHDSKELFKSDLEKMMMLHIKQRNTMSSSN